MRRIELTTVRIALGLALGLPAVAAFAACSADAPAEAEIQAKFDDLVGASQDCDPGPEPLVTNQCVLVYPGCPLGQFVAVRRDKAVQVNEEARKLLRQYANDDKSCAYVVGEGDLAPDAFCNEGKCDTRPGKNGSESRPPDEPDAGE